MPSFVRQGIPFYEFGQVRLVNMQDYKITKLFVVHPAVVGDPPIPGGWMVMVIMQEHYLLLFFVTVESILGRMR